MKENLLPEGTNPGQAHSTFVIVTGMSGAGKSTALKMLEDGGYFCVDNLPLPLVDRFISFAKGSGQGYEKIALGLDARTIRSDQDVAALLEVCDELHGEAKILYLEAADTTLIKRYKETRRSHPLSREGTINDGIALERSILKPLKERAEVMIDTSRMLTRDLRQELARALMGDLKGSSLFVTVMSFGFKYGIPEDADLVFDVRFLPNPYYVDALRMLTGNDPAVQDYVMQGDAGSAFAEKWFALLDFLLPHYIAEGKTQLVIAVGCTGGKHRSVTMANRLYAHLSETAAYRMHVEHRDIGK